MGKGDQKTTKGKRVRGSYGKTRPKKAPKPVIIPEKPTKPKAEKVAAEEKPKTRRTKKAAE